MDNEKRLARQRKEKQFRRRITTLSWAVPVFAFGGFFSVWHSISSAVNPPVQAKASVSTTSGSTPAKPTATTTTAAPVLFQTGTRNSQVRTIQEQLYELGYFNHAITDYYGPVTAQAVRSFQTAEHLNPTGEIDNTTLVTLQQAAKNHQMIHLAAPVQPVASKKVSYTTSNAPTRHIASTSTGSAAKNSQAVPVKPASTPAPTTAPVSHSVSVSSQSSSQTRSSAS